MSDTPPNPAELTPSAPGHAEQPPIPNQPPEDWENPKDPTPMFDIHPPHHAASTWRDFFIHIATIDIGLLIAVGLEQIVEFFHHRHQAHQMQESLREESLENQEIAQTDIETLDGWVRDYRAQMDLLQAAPVKEGKVAVTLTPPQTRNGWFPLSDTAWLNVRDGGGLPLLPRDLAGNYWRVNYVVQEAILQGHDFFHTLYEVRSLQHIHGGVMIYTPEERTQLVSRMIQMDGELRNLRSTMGYFLLVNKLALNNEKVTPASFKQTRSESLPPLPWTFTPTLQEESPTASETPH
jgi:hypothetical protein